MGKENPEILPKWMYSVAGEVNMDPMVLEDILNQSANFTGQDITMNQLRHMAATQAGYRVSVEDRRELQAVLLAVSRGDLIISGLELEEDNPESAYRKRWEILEQELIPPELESDYGIQVFWQGMGKLVKALGKIGS